MLLLTISEEKIKQAMAQVTPPAFEVEGLKQATSPTVGPQADQFVISGTVAIPPNNEAARKRLLVAFSKIDISGTTLKTEDELQSELDEIRRRNL